MIGVYFLKKDNNVVYVGKSKDIERRIRSHEVENVKDYDNYSYIECKENVLDETEEFYILYHNCDYNKKRAEMKIDGIPRKKTKKYKIKEDVNVSALERLKNLTNKISAQNIDNMNEEELMEQFEKILNNMRKIRDRE